MKRSDYDALLIKFENSPDAMKVSILESALDLMEQYNGRSRSDCIVLAMGGEYADE